MRERQRANGEGDVYARRNAKGGIIGYRGSYWVQTSEGPKRHYVSGKNKGETRKALAKARGNRDAGLFFDAGNLTLQQYLERWLEDRSGEASDTEPTITTVPRHATILYRCWGG